MRMRDVASLMGQYHHICLRFRRLVIHKMNMDIIKVICLQ